MAANSIASGCSDRNEEIRRRMSRNGRASLDGCGVLRCVDAVDELLARIRNTG